MRKVAMFQSDLFDLSWPKDDSQLALESNPWGEDLADYFREKLSLQGAAGLSGPFKDEDQWVLYYRLGKLEYGTSFLWGLLDDSEENWWILQTWRARGCFGGLFGGKTEPAILSLRQVIEAEPRIKNVAWLTAEEFASVYGAPGGGSKLRAILRRGGKVS